MLKFWILQRTASTTILPFWAYTRKCGTVLPTLDIQSGFIFFQAGLSGQAAPADPRQGGRVLPGQGREGPLHCGEEPQRQQGRGGRDKHQGEIIVSYVISCYM